MIAGDKMMMHFNKTFYIGNTLISESSQTFIIAEAGVNHNGDIDMAQKLVDSALQAGVNAVKFQTFRTDEIILKSVEKAPYQKKTTNERKTQYEMLKELELSYGETRMIRDYCREKGILFLSTPFDQMSLKELGKLDLPAIKIAATDLTNIQYVRQVAKVGKPIILSAGMCYLDEIRLALEAIYPLNKNVILLQCTANYPLEDHEVNLNVIDTLKREYDILVGFSDHSQGIGAAPYAVAKGAKVIEKHFTLDKHAEGPDHKASIMPEELKQLVSDIRKVEKFLGSGIKRPSLSEQYTRRSLQKCMVAAKNIKKGERFTENNVTAKRTNGEGISALYYDDLLNRTAPRDFIKDDILEVTI